MSRKNKISLLSLYKNKIWTDQTFIAYAIMASLPSLVLSKSELNYINKKWLIYDQLMNSKSAAQLCLKMELFKSECTNKLVDYITITICFSQIMRELISVKKDVIIDIIDNRSDFDEAIKNPRYLKILFRCLETKYNKLALNYNFIRKIIAHVLTKFTELQKMNFMFINCKNGKRISRFPQKDINEWFNYDI